MKIQFNDKILEIKEEQTIEEILKQEIKNSHFTVVGAKFNNQYKSLDYKVKTDGKIELIDIAEKEGMKIYIRTLIYIMGKAIEEIYPDLEVRVNYQLNNSMFCQIDNVMVTEEVTTKIENRMREIVERDLPITRKELTREEAKELYEKTKTSRGRLQYDLEENEKIVMNYCEKYFNYIYGVIATKTGVTKIFELRPYSDGFLLKYPSSKNPTCLTKYQETKKLSWALDEYDDIHKILNINTVFKLNKMIKDGKTKDIIMLDEALHEKKIAQMADKIAQKRNVKMVLIAGPSSSGKTTFAQRLGIQLRLNGLKPVTISVDNYFVERADTPKDEKGDYDFECIEAIDLELFNEHLIQLLEGKTVEMPEFDFKVGTKKYNGKMMSLAPDEILVIEGIHCLNDKLTERIPKDQKYKIYVSALTVLNMDRFNRISTTDTRLVRRIVRDHQFRGYSAKHTIAAWPSVNRGEEKNIFTYQEEADSMFNTSLIYELNAFKKIAMPLLDEIDNTSTEYAEAQRLKNMLQYFEPIDTDEVPKTSLLKEFLGGGNFSQ